MVSSSPMYRCKALIGSVKNLATGRETKITDSGFAFDPAWNSGGSKLAYSFVTS
jgi:Tol biopolymer transport system component